MRLKELTIFGKGLFIIIVIIGLPFFIIGAIITIPIIAIKTGYEVALDIIEEYHK